MKGGAKLEISIFTAPKRVTPEQWIETLTDVIIDAYTLFDAKHQIKKALFNAADSNGSITFKKFIGELRKDKAENEDEWEYDERKTLADVICPMFLRKNEWTANFDVKDGKSLEGMSAKALRNVLKESYDRNFSNFVLMLWTKINLPEAYELM